MSNSVSRSLIAFLALAAAAHAGVIVVDAQNGPGTDFTTLKAALAAAANGDVLLVRTGVYDGAHVMLNKAVSIVADSGAGVAITNTDLTSPTNAALLVTGTFTSSMLIQGCTFQSVFLTPTTAAGGALRIATNTATGHVFVDDCAAITAVGNGIDVAGGCRTTLTRCFGTGGNAVVSGPVANSAGVGLFASTSIDGSFVSAFASDFTGGNGLDQPAALTPTLLAGGSGIRASTFGSSRKVLVSGTSIQGGVGGDTVSGPPNCTTPGAGGHGLEVIAGLGPYVVDPSFAGGAAGTDQSTCELTGVPGQPVAVTFLGLPPAPLVAQPSRISVASPVREGVTVTVSIQGPVNHAAFAVIGFAQTHVFEASLSGSLVATPNAIVALGALPPSGSVTLSTHAPSMPVGVDAGIVYLQPITQDMTTGQATLGAPAALVILDDSL
ncbi:MAG: hypothetical protein IPH13_18860 [Planctomycetes bacterium]|nr:hypothetical protein [Planctomycetota bacterium]MCC7169175.1 hypothetical protein [Planctomycetota bacterium]